MDEQRNDRPAAGALRLDEARVRESLPGWDVVLPDHTGSTNADALAMARAGAAAPAVVATVDQRAGRGRMSRAWETPPGVNLALSALLRPEGVPLTRLGLLPLVAGMAVRDALREAAGVDAQVKWPNDVLVGGRKICGILVEAASLEPPAMAVGIGVNVLMTREQLPVPHATSLALEGASDLDASDLLAAVCRALEARADQWRTDVAGFLADFRDGCVTVGMDVRVELPDGSAFTGRATGVGGDGELEVVDDAGRRHVVTAGDVRHVRAAGGGYAGDGA
ncbi:biotin--[acetyl-CoA-carboxylase] ligase [Corynebacterium sp. 335C]